MGPQNALQPTSTAHALGGIGFGTDASEMNDLFGIDPDDGFLAQHLDETRPSRQISTAYVPLKLALYCYCLLSVAVLLSLFICCLLLG